MNRTIQTLSLLLVLVFGFFSGIYYEKDQASLSLFSSLTGINTERPENVDFSLLWQAWNIIHERYVDNKKINDQELIYGAVEGLVNKVGDPYTVFLTPKESESFSQEIGGSFGGIGIEIGIREETLTVITPIKDTPAAKAGLLTGDKILKIDEKVTDGIKVEEAVKLIRGERGTKVKLTIDREKIEAPFEVSIARDTIKIPAVHWELVDADTAHLELLIFNKNVDSEFKKAADEIRSSSAKKIILDLRNNPGGLLDSAVNIAGYFLEKSQVVTIERFADGTENSFSSSGSGELKHYPLVILINEGSASASEILAGALKDNRNVKLIGKKSFGKGSVQEIVDLIGKSSLKVTVAKWLTPKGTSINDQGIKPDFEVELTPDDVKNEKDPQLDKAKEIIKKN